MSNIKNEKPVLAAIEYKDGRSVEYTDKETLYEDYKNALATLGNSEVSARIVTTDPETSFYMGWFVTSMEAESQGLAVNLRLYREAVDKFGVNAPETKAAMVAEEEDHSYEEMPSWNAEDAPDPEEDMLSQ